MGYLCIMYIYIYILYILGIHLQIQPLYPENSTCKYHASCFFIFEIYGPLHAVSCQLNFMKKLSSTRAASFRGVQGKPYFLEIDSLQLRSSGKKTSKSAQVFFQKRSVDIDQVAPNCKCGTWRLQKPWEFVSSWTRQVATGNINPLLVQVVS